MSKFVSLDEFSLNQELDEGWKENLMIGAFTVLSLIGGKAHAQEQDQLVEKPKIATSGRIGTQVDGIIGQFTSQFKFPDFYLDDEPHKIFKDFDIEGNKIMMNIINKRLSVKHMHDWNDYTEWLKSKHYAGDPKMDHFEYSNKTLGEYKKDVDPEFWIKSESEIKKVQAAIKDYRVFVVNMWKSGKTEIKINGKYVKYSKDADKYFMTWAR